MLTQGSETFWLIWGFVFQFIFGLRFVVQWIASEMRKASYIPIAFWYLSIAGSLGLFAYAVYRGDPVFILGQSLSGVIYIRNIVLVRKSKAGEQRETVVL